MSDQPARRCVVILFGSPAPGYCDLAACPSAVHGPFTRAEAEAYAERLPDGFQPHILTLEPPMSL